MKAKHSNPLLFVLRRFFAAQAVFVSFLNIAQGANEIRYWDGGTANIAATGNGMSEGTAGTWNTTLTNWDQGPGLAHVAWGNANNDFAVFGGTAGTVTLSSVQANALTFNTTGFLLTGSTLTLSGPGPSLTSATGVIATINSILAGTTGMRKEGPGTVILGAANTFTGGATVNGGELQALLPTAAATYAYLGAGAVTVNSGATLRLKTGSTANVLTLTNALTLNSGTVISEDGSMTMSGAVALSGANTVNGIYAGKNLTLSGVVSGNGSVNKLGPASLILSNAGNTYSGNISVSGGILQIAAAGNLGKATLAFPTAGAGLTITGTAVTLTNDISLGAVSGNINLDTPNSSSTVFSGTISGGGPASVWFLRGGAAGQNSGAITLSGTNTLQGTLNVQRGPLILTNAAAAGTASIKLDSNNHPNGALQLAGNFTLPNNVLVSWAPTQRIGVATGIAAGISGVIGSTDATVGIEKVGAGTLTLAGANTLTGPTTVTAGTLQLDYTTQANSKLADAAALNMAGGTLDLAGNNGTPLVEAVGSTIVSGTSTISRSGSTANSLALGEILQAGGTLDFTADSLATTTTTLTNGLLPGFITVNGGIATKDGLDNIIAYTGFADVFRLGDYIATGAGSNVRIVEGGSSGNVTLAGAGTTTINTLSNAGTLAPTTIDLGSGNTLRLSDVGTIGAGSNGLTITGGTLTAGGTANTSGLLDVVNSSAIATTISSVIANNGSGAVSLLKSGGGVLVLNSTNTYTGTTTVNGGTLAAAGGSAIPDSGAVILANNAGAALRLDANETIGSLNGGAASGLNLQSYALTLADNSDATVAGTVSGTGSLVKNGSGILTLTGANAFSGGILLNVGTLQAAVSSTAANALGTGAAAIAGGTILQLNNINTVNVTPVIGNAFVGEGLLKLNFAAGTTVRNTTLNNLAGFNGTIQLSNAGATGDKWTVAGLGTVPAAVVVDSGSQLFISTAPTTFAGGVTLQGTGNSELRGGLRLSSTLGSNITLAGDTTIGAETGAVLTGNITSGTTSPVTLTVNTTNSAGNSVFSGNIGGGLGTISLTKITASTMTLAGTNTYSGNTTLNAGTLNLTGSSANSALTMAAATTLSGEGTIGSLTTLGASNLVISPATQPGALTSAGAVTLGGLMTVSFAGTPPTAGTFRVLNYTGADPAIASFALANSANYRSPQFTAASGAVNLSIGKANLTWTGTGGLNWDVKTTSNWKDSGNLASQFYFNDAVTFDDSVGANQTVTLTAAVQPSSITFNNSAYSYTLAGGAGNIGGGTGITKNGTGTVTLGGANGQNFTGAIAVNAGVLKMGSRDAFGLSSGVTIANNAQVDINGQQPGSVATGGYAYTIIGNGGDGNGAIVNTGVSVASNAGVKSLTLTGNASVSAVTASRFDVGFANLAGGGLITGNGFTLTKKGAGDVGFRGDASASPINYVIEAGTSWAENTGNAFGGATGTLTIKSGARGGTYGALTVPTPVTVESGGTLHNQGGGTGTWSGAITLNDGAIIDTGTEIAIAGTATLAPGGQLAKAGTNQLTVTGSLLGSGGTLNQNAGTIQIGALGTTGAITGFPTINLGAGVLFRNRLSGASNGVGSNFTFANATSEVRQHAGLADDSFTLTGTIGTNVANGILRSTFGRLILAAGSSTTVSMVAAQGAPTVGRGSIDVQTGASLTSPYFNIGQDTTNSGVVNVTGGTVTVPTGGAGGTNAVRIGHWNNGSATVPSELNVTAGTFDASATNLVTAIGWDGYGTMTVGGGGTPALAKVWRILADANGDSTGYADTITVLPNGTLEVGAGGTAGPVAGALNDYILLNGGTINGSADSTWAARIEIPAATTSFASANAGVTVTQTGALTGTGVLTKTGTGNLVLTGGSFPGTATATAGTLFIGTTAFTAATIATSPGGNLQPGVLATAGISTMPTLVFNGGSATFRASATGGDKFLVSGTDSFSVPTQTTLRVIPTGVLQVGDNIPLIDYNGAIGGLGFGGLTLAPLANPHFSAHLVDDTTNADVVAHIDAVDSLIWKGNLDGTWNVNQASNWETVSNNLTSKFYDFDSVKFTDAGTANPNVTLVGTIQPSSVSFDATINYTLSGAPITGATGLTKSNTGSLTLLNDNSYVGAVIINGGTVIVGNGGTTGALGGTGNIALNDATLAFNRSDAQTLARMVVGIGTLVKNGAGTLLLTALNTYSGGTSVTGGTLALQGTNSSAGTIVGPLSIGAGATVSLLSANALGYNGTQVTSISINGGTLETTAVGDNGWGQVFNLTGGTMRSNGGVSSGTATQLFAIGNGSAFNTFGNAVTSTVSGRLTMRQANTTFTVEDGAAAVDLEVSAAMTENATLSGITKAGTGTLLLTGTNTYTGTTVINAGTLQIGSGSTTGSLGTGGVTNNAELVFNRSDAVSVATAIGGTGNLTQSGTGTLTLSGGNTYTGKTTVAAGVLAVNGSSIADTGTLTITGGKVAPTGIEIVDKLFFGTAQQAAGTWGSTTSTADHKDDTYFSGTGVVMVSSGGGFGSWIAGFGLSAANQNPTADPDSDGLNNLLEYALGGLPNVSDAATIGPKQSRSGDNLILTFLRSDLSESDTVMSVGYGNALPGVTSVVIGAAPGSGMVAIVENGDAPDAVTVTIPTGGSAKFFATVKVAQ